MGGEESGTSSIHYCISRVAWRTHDHPTPFLQGKLGLNYDDPVAVNEEIPHSWWLADESCKYILSVLVHKDNKDLSTSPTKQPPGPTRAVVREKKTKQVENERSAAKAQRPVRVEQPDGTVVVEKYGDVDHQSKKAKVDGMRSVIDKNRVDAIMSQISVMRGLEEIYVGRMGREEYERRLVNLANQMPGMMEQTPQGDDLFTPPLIVCFVSPGKGESDR